MKKLLHKVLKKSAPPPETGGRITNETVAEHRERILAGGRKFKYPMQYTKRRVIVISLVIVIIATVSFLGFGAWQLYGAQSTDKFMYRLTQVVPVPAAQVSGDWVRYSDYLRELRSAVHYLSTKEAVNFNSDDGQRQLEYQKRLALNKAIENTLVSKLAKQQSLSVSEQEVDAFVKKQVSGNRLGVSEDAYRQIIRDYYDWSFDEYKDSIKKQLLRKKVMARLDTDARQKIESAITKLEQKADFAAVTKELSEDLVTKDQGGDVGFVAKDANDSNGLIAAASKLEPNQVSGILEGVDGFYIIKLLERRGEAELHLAKLFVGYKILDKRVAELRQKGQVSELIKVKEVERATNQQ